jgi:hypothetical protein
MPKRVIDFDAMWGSDKLASCAEWAQAEYAWLYGLADASGCFELTNLRVIWGRVAAIRRNLTIERLEQIFDEFQVKGLLFVWEHEGKGYGHWTGSDVPGRLPAPSWKMRLERLAPPVPKRQFAEYVSRFARGRAALAGGGFRGETERAFAGGEFESSDLKFERPEAERAILGGSGARETHATGGLRPLKDRLEAAQAQDWNSDRELERKENLRASGIRAPCGEAAEQRSQNPQNLLLDLNSKAQFNPAACGKAANPSSQNPENLLLGLSSNAEPRIKDQQAGGARGEVNRRSRTAVAGASPAWRDKASLLDRELAVGRGPVCGPVRVNPKAIERMRARDAARAATHAGSRSP